MRVRVLPRAERDLDELALHIANDDLEAAMRFLSAFVEACERLAATPEAGCPRRFIDSRLEGIRMWPVPSFPNHLIFYRVVEGVVEIARVLHGARDVLAALGEPTDRDRPVEPGA